MNSNANDAVRGQTFESIARGLNCAGPYYPLLLGGLLDTERQFRVGEGLDGIMHQARRDRIRDDIAGRIKRACSHLAEDEFRRLVDDMTDRQLKGERRVIRDYLLE